MGGCVTMERLNEIRAVKDERQFFRQFFDVLFESDLSLAMDDEIENSVCELLERCASPECESFGELEFYGCALDVKNEDNRASGGFDCRFRIIE